MYKNIHSESGKHFNPELVLVFFEITDILRASQKKIPADHGIQQEF